jgi:hypothetical protein
MSKNDLKANAPPSDNDEKTDTPPPRLTEGGRPHRRAASEATSHSLQARFAAMSQQGGIVKKFSPSMSRGKDWQSFSHANAERLVLSDSKSNLKKTSLLNNDGEFSSSLSIDPKVTRPLSAPPGRITGVVPAPDGQDAGAILLRKGQRTGLALSPIHVVYSRAPLASQDFGSLSPASLDTYSQPSLPSIVAFPRSLPPNNYVQPKNISAFQYALGPFFENLDDHVDMNQFRLTPLSKHEDESEASDSLQYDEELYGVEVQRAKATELADYGISEDIQAKILNANIRSLQVRVLLMRCNALQTTIRELQHKPWVRAKTRTPRWHYEQMRKLAFEARSLAESLASEPLLARCEYWVGRACGGTRDYGDAEKHFWKARQLDVENDKNSKSGSRVLRGLRPTEKADLKFLWQSCIDRHADYLKREKPNHEWAELQAEATGIPIQVLIEESIPQSPEWVPDRDRVMMIAQSSFDPWAQRPKAKLPLATPTEDDDDFIDPLGEEMESNIQAQWKAEDDGVRDIYRRILSRNEWKYIKNEDYKARHQIARQESPDGSTNRTSPLHTPAPKTLADLLESLSTRSDSIESISEDAARERGWTNFDEHSVPSISSFEQSLPLSVQLMSRLATAEQISPTTLSQSDVEPSEPQSLQQRRGNMNIPAIQTESSQPQPRLGRDTQTSSPASEVNVQ